MSTAETSGSTLGQILEDKTEGLLSGIEGVLEFVVRDDADLLAMKAEIRSLIYSSLAEAYDDGYANGVEEGGER